VGSLSPFTSASCISLVEAKLRNALAYRISPPFLLPSDSFVRLYVSAFMIRRMQLSSSLIDTWPNYRSLSPRILFLILAIPLGRLIGTRFAFSFLCETPNNDRSILNSVLYVQEFFLPILCCVQASTPQYITGLFLVL
jgi:hypothetical protein